MDDEKSVGQVCVKKATKEEPEKQEGEEDTGKDKHRATEDTEGHREELEIWMDKTKSKALHEP